ALVSSSVAVSQTVGQNCDSPPGLSICLDEAEPDNFMTRPHYLFVTGKLAEPALRRTLAELAPKVSFDIGIAVLPISVVSLASTTWIARHLSAPANVDRVILPGLCPGDLNVVEETVTRPVERGPADLRDLPEYYGQDGGVPAGYGDHDITILAE